MIDTDTTTPVTNDQVFALFCLTVGGWIALIAMCIGFYTMFTALF